MIDSAMTPEPMVATVRFESDDMRASIGSDTGSRRLRSREIRLRWRAAGEIPGFGRGPPQVRNGSSPGATHRLKTRADRLGGRRSAMISSARRGEEEDGGAETDTRVIA